ncbi:hypothetical protein PVAP13_5KG479307 [Panicum virgatum]|uniref:Uncharacterized protein n=1 Tax=Panicum virgatum TaxID=38727 RepID=A0A8T0SSP5_PANVG|nr:hypothetical protein PVAP13_5KG479307 [Panicum virgatum]
MASCVNTSVRARPFPTPAKLATPTPTVPRAVNRKVSSSARWVRVSSPPLRFPGAGGSKAGLTPPTGRRKPGGRAGWGHPANRSCAPNSTGGFVRFFSGSVVVVEFPRQFDKADFARMHG